MKIAIGISFTTTYVLAAAYFYTNGEIGGVVLFLTVGALVVIGMSILGSIFDKLAEIWGGIACQ